MWFDSHTGFSITRGQTPPEVYKSHPGHAQKIAPGVTQVQIYAKGETSVLTLVDGPPQQMAVKETLREHPFCSMWQPKATPSGAQSKKELVHLSPSALFTLQSNFGCDSIYILEGLPTRPRPSPGGHRGPTWPPPWTTPRRPAPASVIVIFLKLLFVEDAIKIMIIDEDL